MEAVDADGRKPDREGVAPYRAAQSATLAGRLLICRELSGINKSEAARILGIAASSYGDLELGKSKRPSAQTLLGMRDRLGWSPDYVMKGKGAPLLPGREDFAREQTLLHLFRALPDYLKDEVVRYIRVIRNARGDSDDLDDYPPRQNS
jgi:transcriptional regulator with XRE-family HTH domain